MKLGVRGKLFAVSVGLILAVVLASGVYLQGELRDQLEARIEAELADYARSAGIALSAAGSADTVAEIDALADRLSGDTGTRITVIGADGQVLGDSSLSPSEIGDVDNHGRRPEIVAARSDGRGLSRRYSKTLDDDLMYVAVAFDHGGEVRVVRAARTLASVKDAVGRLRVLLIVAGLLGLLVAILMSGLASHYMSRTLRKLVDTARRIASGDPTRRIAVHSSDELAGLAGSLNRMAEDLEGTIGALADERARFRAVLESLSDAVVALDDHDEVALMNRAAVDLLGLEEAPAHVPILEIVRTPGLQTLLGDRGDAEVTEFDLPGTTRRVSVRRSPMQAGSVLVFQDVTEIRRLETVRRDFVANVSHELRTPVSIVRANAETLLDGAMSDPVHGTRLLEATLRNAERLSNIITDLLDLSRLESGSYQPRSRTVSVREVAQRTVEAVELRASERDTVITIDVSETLSALADDKALEHILLNFLENAVKYTPETGHVWITARDDGDRVRIEVRDDGPGIEPRHRGRVFERFYRIDPGRSRDMGGTGLGLAIVKHLADAMGGDVGVEPAEPHGSVFWIELPRADAAFVSTAADPDVTHGP